MVQVGESMTAQRSERVQSIQLMRVFLGIMVATYHYIYNFAVNIGEGFPAPASDYQFGSAGMVSFFFMSGYIITFASKNEFGSAEGSRRFLVKRFTRILPTYWFSTFLLAGLFLFMGVAFQDHVFWRSLLLLPSWAGSDQPFPQPLNYPGWTLFIEMAFYFTFALGIAFGRRATYILCTLAAVIATLVGTFYQPESAIGFMLTRPIYLLFPLGIVMALWRGQGGSLKVWHRLLLFALAVLVYFTADYPSGGIDLGWEYLYWAGVPAVLTCIAILGGPMQVPFFPFIDRLGDAFFSLYILHIPMGWIWVWGFQKVIVGQPILFFATLLGSSMVASWYFYHWIEIPLIRKLNAMLGATGNSKRERQLAEA